MDVENSDQNPNPNKTHKHPTQNLRLLVKVFAGNKKKSNYKMNKFNSFKFNLKLQF